MNFIPMVIRFFAGLAMAVSIGGTRAATDARATGRWQPIDLRESKLDGEIGRRIRLTTENNFNALDLERDFIAPFRQRRTPEEVVKRFGDNAVELGENLHAAVWFASHSPSPDVRARKDAFIREILATQSASGYIGVFVEEPRGRQLFRNYCFEDASFIVFALADNYRLFRDEASLRAAVKLADFIIGSWENRPAEVKFSPLGGSRAFLALFEATGDRRYLRFGADAAGGGLFLSPLPLREWQQEIYQTRPLDYENSRALTRVLPRGLYPESTSYTYPADRVHMYSLLERAVAQLRLDAVEPAPRLWQMSARILAGVTDSRRAAMAVTGATGWHEGWNEDHDGRGPLGETCANVTLFWFMEEWLRARHDLRFGDVMERVLYNAVFGAQEPEGRRLRYFTPFSGERRYFELDTYCCPGNFRRCLAHLPRSLYYTGPGELVVNLFNASTVDVDVPAAAKVRLVQRTDYPSDGKIEIEVTPDRTGEFSIIVRVPRWCPDPRLAVNGAVVAGPRSEEYCTLRRTWSAGDRIAIEFPLSARWVRGLGMQTRRVALLRGPLVFGLNPARNPALAGLNLREVTVDVASPGSFAADHSVRPSGVKFSTKGWKPGSALTGPPDVELCFTEYTDPGVAEIYFRPSKTAPTVEDELLRPGQGLLPETLRFTNEEQTVP